MHYGSLDVRQPWKPARPVAGTESLCSLLVRIVIIVIIIIVVVIIVAKSPFYINTARDGRVRCTIEVAPPKPLQC
jgi:hypothetical protein